jgi:hypothetical protein
VFVGSLHAAAARMFFHKFQHCFTSSFLPRQRAVFGTPPQLARAS